MVSCQMNVNITSIWLTEIKTFTVTYMMMMMMIGSLILAAGGLWLPEDDPDWLYSQTGYEWIV